LRWHFVAAPHAALPCADTRRRCSYSNNSLPVFVERLLYLRSYILSRYLSCACGNIFSRLLLFFNALAGPVRRRKLCVPIPSWTNMPFVRHSSTAAVQRSTAACSLNVGCQPCEHDSGLLCEGARWLPSLYPSACLSLLPWMAERKNLCKRAFLQRAVRSRNGARTPCILFLSPLSGPAQATYNALWL